MMAIYLHILERPDASIVMMCLGEERTDHKWQRVKEYAMRLFKPLIKDVNDQNKIMRGETGWTLQMRRVEQPDTIKGTQITQLVYEELVKHKPKED
jgi:hypothetical protein